MKRMLRGVPVLNLVYRFVPDAWGRGLATGAAAIVSGTSEAMPATTIVARVRPDNESSRNVALKFGLRRDAALDDEGEDGPDWLFRNRVR